MFNILTFNNNIIIIRNLVREPEWLQNIILQEPTFK